MHRFLLLFSELFPAFFCALPIGMGVGGAGLYVLFLTTFGHLPQVEAQGKNLLFFLAAAASGVLQFIQGTLHGHGAAGKCRRQFHDGEMDK